MCKGFRKHIRVWALCLATLFAAYYATTALFTHVHVVNGVMLVHSHPFSHSHSHSDGQTLALHFLSTFSSLEPGHTEVETPDLHLLYSLPYIKNTFHAVCCCTEGMYLVLLLYYRSYWEFEEHSINFLGANNEKYINLLMGVVCALCQLYYCIR